MQPSSAVLARYLSDIWGGHNMAAADELLAPGLIDHFANGEGADGVSGMDRAAHDRIVAALHRGLPDLEVEVQGVFGEGDLAFGFWRLTGTHDASMLGAPATGRRLAYGGMMMVRVQGGRVAEVWRVEENLLALIEMGAVQAPFGGAPAAEGATQAETRLQRRCPLRFDPAFPGSADVATRARRHVIAREHIEEMWGRGRVELGEKLYDPDCIDHNPAPGQRPGLPGIIDVLLWLQEGVTDLRMTVHNIVCEGYFAADRWTITGMHDKAPLMGIAPRGRNFRFNGMDCIRLNGADRITDVWHVEQFDRLREQLA
jgi:predicted ester cyclase